MFPYAPIRTKLAKNAKNINSGFKLLIISVKFCKRNLQKPFKKNQYKLQTRKAVSLQQLSWQPECRADLTEIS